MNTHKINDDESDIDGLNTLTSSHASSISSINSSITTINNKLGGSSSSGLKTLTETNLTNITNIANNSVSSNLKSAVDSNSAKNSYPTGDSAKMNKIIISTSGSNISLNSLSNTMNANSSNITTLQNAFPKQTTIRHYAIVTADLYNDGFVKFNWDGTNKQLRFFVLSITSGQYLTGGVQIWRTSSSFQTATFVSQSNSSAYKYFTTFQNSSTSTLNSTYNLTTNYSKVCYFLTPYLLLNYPSYEITILIGYNLGYHTINIKRFN